MNNKRKTYIWGTLTILLSAVVSFTLVHFTTLENNSSALKEELYIENPYSKQEIVGDEVMTTPTYENKIKNEHALKKVNTSRFGHTSLLSVSDEKIEEDTKEKMKKAVVSSSSTNASSSNIEYSSNSVETYMLAKIIHAEAGGESYLGRVAVGAVIINRVKDDRFPDNIKDVIFAPKQFEPIRNGRYTRSIPTSSDMKAAKEALSGNDPTYGATYFYAPTLTSARWHETLDYTTTIGVHRFFSK